MNRGEINHDVSNMACVGSLRHYCGYHQEEDTIILSSVSSILDMPHTRRPYSHVSFI